MKKPTVPLEKEECKIFAQWLDVKGLRFSHIANESINKIEAMNKYRLGVRKGVPDYLIILPSKNLLFIEMKRKKGSVVSQEQKDWLHDLNQIPSVQCEIAYGAEEAINIVNHFLNADRTDNRVAP